MGYTVHDMDGLVQDCSISGVLPMEILQSCNKPLTCGETMPWNNPGTTSLWATHCDLVMSFGDKRRDQQLVLACRLFCAKSLAEPMLTICKWPSLGLFSEIISENKPKLGHFLRRIHTIEQKSLSKLEIYAICAPKWELPCSICCLLTTSHKRGHGDGIKRV